MITGRQFKRKMKNGLDFLNLLNCDVSLKILTNLEDPSDLVRFSAASRSWRQFDAAFDANFPFVPKSFD
ncbi:F-box protein isoform X1 [Gossypium australe]|uniref:F-box protein isoform X1 n=1 Tax=Gossypium australe TaxID=47621 RepID=A0A5B6W264_9ROSI|nr:F-box protein isoform X1 [Gossypium australe]